MGKLKRIDDKDRRMSPAEAQAVLLVPLFLSLACTDSAPSAESNPKPNPEQDLVITFGGFLQNGPEDQLLDGQCQANPAKDVLQCDMHNGLMKWNITEITFQVIRTGDREDEHRRPNEPFS